MIVMEIYVDVVFAVNFLMDTFVFWIVGRMAGKKCGARLAAGGALMAALCCLLIFAGSLRVYQNIFAALLIVMLGCMVTFRPRDVKEFLKLVAFTHAAAFTLGGLAMGLFYFTNIAEVAGNMLGATTDHFSFKILLTATCCSYIIIKLLARRLRRLTAHGQVFRPCTIHLGGADASLTALYDTGNILRDPVSGAPVIVVEFDALKTVLPEQVRSIFDEGRESDLGLLLRLVGDGALAARFRVIPFESLGRQHGILLGFRPDKVDVSSEKGTVSYNRVVVGIYNCRLSSDNTYQGLLNAELA
jgi:stage II sporulation protein GA (sporulation sigma-E factor processing peptidase)